MARLSGKNILILIPRSRFCESELLETRSLLQAGGARIVVLSPSGRETRGMDKTLFQPDGMIVDWNRQEGITRKYDAVIVSGGKGAPKSLWDDPIIPQILTDHYRAGSVIGALGLGGVVLARAALLTGDAAATGEEPADGELKNAGADPVARSVVRCGRVVTARGADAVAEFVGIMAEILCEVED